MKFQVILLLLILGFCTGTSLEAQNLPRYILSVNPFTLLSAISVTQSAQGNDTTPAVGAVGIGMVQDSNREDILGVSWLPGFFDVDWQSRHYLGKAPWGFFWQTYLSLEWLETRTYKDASQGMVISTSTGQLTNLLGVRLGAGIGYRFWWQTWGLTPRLGINLPVFYLLGTTGYSTQDLASLYGLMAFLRCWEVGLTVDLPL